MKMKKAKKKKMPKDWVYNPELDKYSNVVLFPKKLELANEILKKAPVPKWILEL